MNFKELSEHLVTQTCPLGSGFELTWDANKFNGECFRRMGRSYKERARQFESDFKAARNTEAEVEPESDSPLGGAVESYERMMEMSALSADILVELYADILASDRYGIIREWKLDDGTPPTFDNLRQVPGESLKFIFEFCRDSSGPKGQGTPTQTLSNPTTSETISDGSSDPTTRLPESRPM